MMFRSGHLSLIAVFVFGIQIAQGADDSPKPLPLPPLANVARAFDGKTGKALSLEQVVDRALQAEVVFLGETHLDESTHRIQHFIYERMLARTQNKVVLAMEMFERDAQPTLDQYLSGEIDERTFLRDSGAWGNYRTDYRSMVELAKLKKMPVVAANFPASVRRKIRGGGKEAYLALSKEDKQWIPRKLFHNSDAYWDRFNRAVRGHFDDMLKGHPDKRLYATQCLWDNAMGEACVDALAANPGFKVLHLNGGFHTMYRLGTAEQVMLRRPQTKMLAIDIRTTSDLALVFDEEPDEAGDIIIVVEDRARALNEGTHAVQVSRELEYLLKVPSAADADNRVPLIIWLPREGLRASDGQQYLDLAFGSEVATVVIESPFPAIEENLYRGGRWYFEEDFSSQVWPTLSGIRRLLSRVLQHYPIDPTRVVLAGESTAATIISQTMLYGGSMPVQAFAIAPSKYNKLHESGLPKYQDPDPPYLPFAYQDLTVFASPDHQDWWSAEMATYRKCGVRAKMVGFEADGARQVENALRSALGLKPAPEAGAEELTLVLRHNSSLAQFWAGLEARRQAESGKRVRIVVAGEEYSGAAQLLSFDSEPTLGDGEPLTSSFLNSFVVPRAPGAFGGVTVLVTYPGLSPEVRQRWQDSVDSIKLSRFHTLRIAHVDGTPSLGQVLDELRNSGKNNVLIVPAAFCATSEEMRALRSVAKGSSQGMTLHWLPGLGARYAKRIDFTKLKPGVRKSN